MDDLPQTQPSSSDEQLALAAEHARQELNAKLDEISSRAKDAEDSVLALEILLQDKTSPTHLVQKLKAELEEAKSKLSAIYTAYQGIQNRIESFDIDGEARSEVDGKQS